MQHEITRAIPLLDSEGNLTEPGYAKKLQKSLLNRFTAYITLIGVLFLGQLVNLINKDNPML